MTAPQVITNPPANLVRPADTTVSYDISRVIRMTREEWRIQSLHDMANIFESAFDALEVRP